MPHLIEFHKEFAPQGVTIIGVAMYYDRPDRVLAMTEAKSLPYRIALDPMAAASKAFGDVRLTPTNFLIDAKGMIVEQKIGEFDPEIWRDKLKKLLEAV
jgi:peroxiredoxin